MYIEPLMDRQVCFECSKTVTVTGKKKLRWDRHGCNCVPVTVTVYEGLVAARDIKMRVGFIFTKLWSKCTAGRGGDPDPDTLDSLMNIAGDVPVEALVNHSCHRNPVLQTRPVAEAASYWRFFRWEPPETSRNKDRRSLSDTSETWLNSQDRKVKIKHLGCDCNFDVCSGKIGGQENTARVAQVSQNLLSGVSGQNYGLRLWTSPGSSWMEDKMKSLDVLVKADSKGGSPDESLGPVETSIEINCPGLLYEAMEEEIAKWSTKITSKKLANFHCITNI